MKAQLPIRESVTTINRDGSRFFLHPADVSGPFSRWRRRFGLLLICIYILLPWIPVNGHPAVLLDVSQRRFHLFGLTLAAQDFWITFFLLTGLGFSLFFITSIMGRLWCGWACPQTVFLEHVFRRVERLIEGDATARRRLDRTEMNLDKLLKRILKHTLFAVLSLAISHIFLAYFISLPELYGRMSGNPAEHWSSFIFVLLAGGILYFNFSWFREQLCIVICPYGRLQSALIDDDSVVIGYDENRGEPRGPPKKEGIGDCIDCTRCVQVCPTGIDIRQGLQIECIGCANCIDACNTIMTRLDRPRGLIRYDSLNGLSGKPRRILRPRIFLYSVLLIAGAGAFTYSASRIENANMNIVRMTGPPYYIGQTTLRNQYMVRVVNKTNGPQSYHLSVDAGNTGLTVSGTETSLEVPPMGEKLRPIVVTVEKANYNGKLSLIHI